MKTPEIPKERSPEPSYEALNDLKNAVKLSPEAAKERDAMVDVYADARDERLDLVRAMKEEGNVKSSDLKTLEMALTA